jgi:hypothetical protein
MRVLYLDTSALVKRYVQEAHSDQVARLLEGEVLAGTVLLAQVKMASAGSSGRTRGVAVLGAWIPGGDRSGEKGLRAGSGAGLQRAFGRVSSMRAARRR